MAHSIIVSGDYETDARATEEVVGREVVRWEKRGVAQPLFAGAVVAGADRHGLPIIREGSTPEGCAPLQVAVGYGDTLTVV